MNCTFVVLFEIDEIHRHYFHLRCFKSLRLDIYVGFLPLEITFGTFWHGTPQTHVNNNPQSTRKNSLMNLFQVVEMSHQLWRAHGRRREEHNTFERWEDFGVCTTCVPSHSHHRSAFENGRHSAAHFKLNVFFVPKWRPETKRSIHIKQ